MSISEVQKCRGRELSHRYGLTDEEYKFLEEHFEKPELLWKYKRALEEADEEKEEKFRYVKLYLELRKDFEAAKKECDRQIAEYQEKIEELYYSLKTLEGNLKVSNMIIEETIKNENGEDSNTVKFSSIKQFAEYIKCFYTVNLDYIQKVLQGNEESENNFENVTDFLPTEPIKVADMLINASKKRTNCMTGKEYDKYIFEKWQLKQIAEHLLIYCNHNGEAEE